MKSSVKSHDKPPTSGRIVQDFLLFCGIFSSLLYVFMNIFVAMQWKEYNSVSQTVSELSAIGAPTKGLWDYLGIGYTLLVTAFGYGILRSAFANFHLKFLGRLTMVYGLLGILWVFAPMHLREDIAAGKGNFSDTMHIVMAIITISIMFAIVVTGGSSFGKNFRIYSIVSVVLFLVFGALTGVEGANIDKGLPTPWIGIWERINIGVFLLWVAVLSIIMLRRNRRIYQQVEKIPEKVGQKYLRRKPEREIQLLN